MITHLIYVPFRGVGVKNGDDEWFKERIEIFKQYTLKSLLNQSNRDFVLWLSFRFEDYGDEQMLALSDYLDALGLRTIMTFNNLMYWDDRDLEKNKDLEDRLAQSLVAIKSGCYDFTIDYLKANYILMTRLD